MVLQEHQIREQWLHTYNLGTMEVRDTLAIYNVLALCSAMLSTQQPGEGNLSSTLQHPFG